MADEKKKGGGWKSLFVADDGEEAPAAPTPAVIPTGGATKPLPAPPPAPIPAAAPAVDEGMVSRLLEDLAESAPEGYKDFIGDLATLADTLPSEELLYRAALKLAGKQGHTPQGLALDYDKSLRLLEEQGRLFAADVETQVKAKVGGREAEVARLDTEIAKLQETLATLAATRETEVRAIATDTAKIEGAKIKFEGAYHAVHAQLTDQKSKLIAYGGQSGKG